MKHYINPYSLLKISTGYNPDVDHTVIKKARQSLFNEIELNEKGTITFKKIELSKSDIITIIDQLDNVIIREFHFFIYQNESLNNFLTSGDLTFFTQFKVESIYKDHEFLDFISPYFTSKYDSVLSHNFKAEKVNNVRAILSVDPISNEAHLEKSFKTIYAFLREIDDEIDKINKAIEIGNSLLIDQDFKGLLELVHNKVNVSLINVLPSYFQSIRNQLAQTINRLSTSVNNKPYNNYKVAFQIIELAKDILTDGLAYKKITEDYLIVKKNFETYTPKTTSDVEPNPKFEAIVTKNDLNIDQTFKIDFIGYGDCCNFIVPSLYNFSVITGPKESIESKIINGRVRNIHTYSYILSPKSSGEFVIQAAAIKINGEIYNTNPITITVRKIDVNREESKKNTTYANSNKSTKHEKKNYSYEIFFCAILGVGFFYAPLQKIVLGSSLLILLFPIIAVFRKAEFSFSYYFKNNFLFIIAALFGFYFTIIAQLFISYYFLYYLDMLFYEVNPKEWDKKKNWGIYPLIFGAIVITSVFNYVSENVSGKSETKSMEYSEVKESAPRTAEEFYNKGKSLGEIGDIQNAISVFQQAISLNPNYFDAFLKISFYKIRSKDYQGAINDLNRANQLDATNSEVYYYRGYAKENLNLLDEAILDLNKSIEINPTYANAYGCRGNIKYDKKNIVGAIEDYDVAIKYNPQQPTFYYARSLAYSYLKDYRSVILDLDRAILLNPDEPQFFFDRGDAKEKINDFSGACSDWGTAKSKGFSVPEYKLNLCIPAINVMKNGNIPGCNFNPFYASPAIENSLKIKVGNTDVAIKIMTVSSNRCIRYVFINQHTTYSITNIPEGKYYLKIAYGKEWAKTSRENNCQGRFTKNTMFKKSDKILDFNLIKSNDEIQIPYFEMELNVVLSEGRLNDYNKLVSSNILETDFYND